MFLLRFPVPLKCISNERVRMPLPALSIDVARSQSRFVWSWAWSVRSISKSFKRPALAAKARWNFHFAEGKSTWFAYTKNPTKEKHQEEIIIQQNLQKRQKSPFPTWNCDENFSIVGFFHLSVVEQVIFGIIPEKWTCRVSRIKCQTQKHFSTFDHG